jgi:hypothetical protein
MLKILLSASIAVFSFGIGSSYAGDGDGYSATTLFTSIQNERAAAAPTIVAQTPTGGTRNSGAGVRAPAGRAGAHCCSGCSRCPSQIGKSVRRGPAEAFSDCLALNVLEA